MSNPTRSFWSRVQRDSAEHCWPWQGTINGWGYGQVSIEGTLFTAHRYAWQLVHGDIPHEMVIDHTCFNRSCVNPSHLRVCTRRQNNENPAGLQRNNTSGYQGVVWRKPARGRKGRWWARVGWMGERVHVGYFDTAEEAGEAARLKRIEMYTHNILDRLGAHLQSAA